MINLNTRSSPLRLLLVLEWILLAIVAIAQILLAIFSRSSSSPFLNILGLGILFVMEMLAPQYRLQKLLYLSFEFILILFMTFGGNIPLFQLLFVALVIRNCVYLEGRSRSLVTGIIFVSASLGQSQRLLNQALLVKIPTDQIGIFLVSFWLMFGLIVLFLQLLVNAILSEQKIQKQLLVANSQLRDYAVKAEELATVKERNQIAREIHDALGHSLTGFNLYLEAALKLLHSDPKEAQGLIIEAKQMGASALKDVRQSVATLRSSPLEGRSLETAINSLLEDFHRSTGILPIHNIALKQSIPNDIKMAVYRITQEALTNIRKYANASEVQVNLQLTPDLYLMIGDNGKGFEPSQNITGFGLQGMRERAIALNGSFKIVTGSGAGCQIIAQFPIADYSIKYDSDSIN